MSELSDSKLVYFFGGGEADGSGAMKPLLGGKGAGLAEMTSLGLPVPPGFTITTECCNYYFQTHRSHPAGMDEAVRASVALYNTRQDLDALAAAVRKAVAVLA